MNGTDDSLDDYRQVYCYEIDNCNALTRLLTDSYYNGLTIFHINIRSYYKNFDQILVLLEDIKITFDIIVFSEAWFDEYKQLGNLMGYDVLFTKGNWNRNDGVVVYVRSDISVTMREVGIGEATGLEMNFDFCGRHYSILALYRSPSMNYYLFINDLEQYCNTLSKISTTYLLIGDVNIDIMTSVDNDYKDSYLNLMYTAGFVACIDRATRVAGESRTCIDHVFIKNFDLRDVTAAILNTAVTDHYAQILKLQCTDQRTTTIPKDNTYVDLTVLDGLIQSQSWDDVLLEKDANKSCVYFLNIINSLQILSTKNKYISPRLNKLKPWITTNMIKNIRKRDRLSRLKKTAI